MADRSAPNLSVFMPAYNAGKYLPSVLERVPPDLWNSIKSFWIINDGSKDHTEDVIKELEKKYPSVQHITFEENRGYGSAVKEGLTQCKKDDSAYIVCLHADGQYPPESIPAFMARMRENNLDILQGSRIASGTAISGGMPLYKLGAGKVLTFLENIVFGLSLTDYHSGFLMYSGRTVNTVPFDELSGSFDIDVEIIASARARGLTVAEMPIPTRYADEESYLNPITYGFRVLGVMIRYLLGKYN